MSRITTDIKYSLIQFFRNRQSVFFAFIFPIMFLALAWFLFGGQSGPQTLYYVDGDGSQASMAFIGSLNSTRPESYQRLRDGPGADAEGRADHRIYRDTARVR